MSRALAGDKPLFQGREIGGRCALLAGARPIWATAGRCSIDAVRREAEARMRVALAGYTLAAIAARVGRKAPRSFAGEVVAWFDDRHASHTHRTTDKICK
jgi:DNA-binding IscR family transcriptional regulator